MRRICLIVFLAAALSTSCSVTKSGPERVIENGIEVVVNGAEPYAVEGEPRGLTVREEFRIDLEGEALASLGLTDVAKIDLDTQGRVYLFRPQRGDGPLVFVFDERGGFIKSFLRRGQGPGEVEYPRFLGMTRGGEIPVFDTWRHKIFFFDKEGILLREIPISQGLRPVGQSGLSVLPNGNYLVQYLRLDETRGAQKVAVGVFDLHFRKLNDLLEYDIFGDINEIDNPVIPFPVFGYSRRAVYACNQKDGPDISVFDLNGKLLRTIRKPFAPVEIPPGFVKALREGIPPGIPLAKTLKLPRVFPAFQYFFADDDGRLFVATFEKEAESGRTICDVFSPDGVFIGRAACGYFDFVKMFSEGRPGEVVIRGDRLACVHEKDSGYKEVIVSLFRRIG